MICFRDGDPFSANTCNSKFLIAFDLIGKHIAVLFMRSPDGLIINSLHSLFMHFSWASSIPTE